MKTPGAAPPRERGFVTNAVPSVPLRTRVVAWALLASGVLLLAAVMSAAAGVELQARAKTTLALRLTRVEATGLELARLEDEALLAPSPDLGAVTAMRQTFLASVDRAAKALPAPSRPALQSTATGFAAVIARIVDALRSGDPALARHLDQTTEDAAYTALHTRAVTLASRARTTAEHDQNVADAAAVWSVLTAVIVVGALVTAGERLRARVDRVDGEQAGLQRSETTFRTLVHHSGDLLVQLDPTGQIRSLGPPSAPCWVTTPPRSRAARSQTSSTPTRGHSSPLCCATASPAAPRHASSGVGGTRTVRGAGSKRPCVT